MALIVKITGGPTLFDATVSALGATVPGLYDVNGTAYPDEHPMFEHGNSAVYDRRYTDGTDGIFDGTGNLELYPPGYAWAASVPGYKIQEAMTDTGKIYQLEPIAPVESQRGEKGGVYDEAGIDSDSTASP